MRTTLTERLGIEAPIIQAPMGGASCPALAAAVSNAGGLGMLALSWSDADDIRSQIGETRALTDRPFGINLVLALPQDDRLAVCLEVGVPIVSLFWGAPGPFVARVHAAGALLIHTAASAADARAAVAAGVDVITAQGWEAGGHVRGEVATLPLVRAVVEAVGATPVAAAGGIADGRAVAAVLTLGAGGAWIGTRFLASEEATIHPLYRERLMAARETDTLHTSLFDVGWPNAPHRVLRNRTVESWEAAGRPPAGARPGEGEVVARTAQGAPIVRYQSATPRAGATGDIDALSLWAGQGVARVTSVQPAGEIVRELMAQAREALREAAAMAGAEPNPGLR
jgi:NAD(P)H-dependent flavin oxidoreductase YrpB (nitropropane dioxygenase family)